jgi:hypothetical protein
MGTLHCFTQETALQTLKDAASVLDYFCQPRSNQTGPTRIWLFVPGVVFGVALRTLQGEVRNRHDHADKL